MTTTICDICKTEIPFGRNHIASLIEGKACLEKSDKTFAFEMKVLQFQFNTTNFAVCKSCIVKAVSRSVAEMVASENVHPV